MKNRLYNIFALDCSDLRYRVYARLMLFADVDYFPFSLLKMSNEASMLRLFKFHQILNMRIASAFVR
jgi:hypothetical protein